MIDFKEVHTGEQWELFARDFLAELGFSIESAPDRGADAGKDLLVTEHLTGKIGQYHLRWLVSCKNLAHSGKAVGESDEGNLLERLAAFGAEGFIGFYSTVPSAGLNSRLQALRAGGHIKDFRIFDQRLIESYLIRIGYADLLMRYFPCSYKEVRPLHLVSREYLPLTCHQCGKDLLEALFHEQYTGLIILARRRSRDDDLTDIRYIEEVAWACKGKCDRSVEKHFFIRGLITGWEDISDLTIPPFFMRWMLVLLKKVRAGERVFSDRALGQMEYFLLALSQKVLRETTGSERNRLFEISD